MKYFVLQLLKACCELLSDHLNDYWSKSEWFSFMRKSTLWKMFPHGFSSAKLKNTLLIGIVELSYVQNVTPRYQFTYFFKFESGFIILHYVDCSRYLGFLTGPYFEDAHNIQLFSLGLLITQVFATHHNILQNPRMIPVYFMTLKGNFDIFGRLSAEYMSMSLKLNEWPCTVW